MVLISLTDVDRVVMRDGKVGTEAECLCKCCNCAACECELDVTIGGVTFPADGQRRTLCIYDDGPAGTIFNQGFAIRLQSTKVLVRGPFAPGPFGVDGQYDPDIGMAGMVSVSAVLQCDPLGLEQTYGPETRLSQFRVILNVGYHQIVKRNGSYPQVGDLCGDWIDLYGLNHVTKVRVWQWTGCNDCGCPDSEPPTRLDSGDYSYADLAAPVECREEYNEPTQTVPTFELDCGPCP